jgi:hypothetical protein
MVAASKKTPLPHQKVKIDRHSKRKKNRQPIPTQICLKKENLLKAQQNHPPNPGDLKAII